jgi:hypothetical protein
MRGIKALRNVSILLKAFPSLMEHQAVKDNATKQRLRAKCRFCENSFCSKANREQEFTTSPSREIDRFSCELAKGFNPLMQSAQTDFRASVEKMNAVSRKN